VMTKGMEIVNDCGPGTEHYAKGFKPPMLAPLLEITDKLHLERCMRVYPHQQDTGGFFIAVLEKKSETPWENDKRCSSNRRLLPWETEADWQRKKQGMCKREETKSMVVETGMSVGKIDHTKVKKEDKPIPNEKMMAAHVAAENTHCADLTSNSVSNTDYAVSNNESEGMIMDCHEKSSLRCYDKLPENSHAIESNADGHIPVKKGDCNELDEDSDVTKNNGEEDLTIKREECDEFYEDAEEFRNNFEEHVTVKKEAELAYEIEDSTENGGVKREKEQEDGNNTDTDKNSEPPQKKVKVAMKGFKEDPFVFLTDEDEHWSSIKEFYGIDDSFPVSQLLVRSFHGKKRNIYLVSKAVKDVMETVDDSHKVINTGMKVFARAENDNVKCSFRLMQEGIEAILPFISKRKVLITQEDVAILLSQNRPFCDQFSSTTKEQFEKIEGQGCIVYVYDPNGPCSKARDTIRCRLIFCGWKAKVSTRLQVSKFDKAHYQVLCGIQPSDDSFQGKGSEEEEEKSALEDEDSMERVEVKVEKDDEQTGFIGDFLNVETPKGSLDVGFV